MIWVKQFRWVLFGGYCIFIIYYTILSRNPGTPKADLRLMWAYQEMLTGHPNWKKDVAQNINNILFFIPFGILLPARKLWAVLVSAFCLSVVVETIQYLGGYGLAEMDDVICNTLGAVVGYLILNRLLKTVGKMDET